MHFHSRHATEKFLDRVPERTARLDFGLGPNELGSIPDPARGVLGSELLVRREEERGLEQFNDLDRRPNPIMESCTFLVGMCHPFGVAGPHVIFMLRFEVEAHLTHLQVQPQKFGMVDKVAHHLFVFADGLRGKVILHIDRHLATHHPLEDFEDVRLSTVRLLSSCGHDTSPV